jgi:protease IV
MSSRKIALGLLMCTLLALLVGVFNAAQRGTKSVGTKDNGYLALIDVSGVISMDPIGDSGLISSRESNAMIAKKGLDDAAKDDDIKGVLLHINSPGGTVGMSQELNAAVKRVAKKKPVVVSMGDLSASGGYYTACAANKIIANPGTLTASIGVIINTMEFSDLMNNKLGVQAVTIKSGKYKDLLSPYRKPRAEELTLIQTLVNDSYHDFLNTVIEDRTRFLTSDKEKEERAEKIRAVADGRIVTGRQALAAGLVDEIGDMEHAYTSLDRMAKEKFHIKGKERLPLIPKEDSEGLLGLIRGLMSSTGGAQTMQPLAQMVQMMPVSLRYPNQPLWVME